MSKSIREPGYNKLRFIRIRKYGPSDNNNLKPVITSIENGVNLFFNGIR
jgi:hypothetical protein